MGHGKARSTRRVVSTLYRRCPGHDVATVRSRQLQAALSELGARVRFNAVTLPFDVLPEGGRTGVRRSVRRRRVSVNSASAAPGHMQEGGVSVLASATLRPVADDPPSEFVALERRFLGVQPSLATECSCCRVSDAGKLQARFYLLGRK